MKTSVPVDIYVSDLWATYASTHFEDTQGILETYETLGMYCGDDQAIHPCGTILDLGEECGCDFCETLAKLLLLNKQRREDAEDYESDYDEPTILDLDEERAGQFLAMSDHFAKVKPPRLANGLRQRWSGLCEDVYDEWCAANISVKRPNTPFEYETTA